MNVKVINGRPVKIWTDYVEETAMQQIENLCSLPFLFHHLALMPDVHAGAGMPIGGVLACVNVVVPNAVGSDIGCGMCAVKTSWKVEDIPAEVLRNQIVSGIRSAIPVGMSWHSSPQDEAFMPQNHEIGKLQVISRHYESALLQIGTLGSGNHFIELQRDEEGILWIMIHSGSRNLGKKVGDYYNKVASELNERWYSSVPKNINLPFLPVGSQEFTQYWKEMRYCVDFALSNRRLMMQRIQAVLSEALPGIEFEPMINIAHNYAAWENHYGRNVIVHRKGATLASKGIIGIIPGSQGTASYIVEGLGNHESFNSCSHGAGRAMSRTQAENTLSLEEEVRKLDALGIVHGITSQRDLQEASSAYKNIDEVIHNELDLIAIKTRLLPVAVVKG